MEKKNIIDEAFSIFGLCVEIVLIIMGIAVIVIIA